MGCDGFVRTVGSCLVRLEYAKSFTIIKEKQ